ncbi:fruit body lectin [Lojkania enalia]|uniref:Fruit body lectin n=1 Tax=Lojkania enalia TaxID=147567 RepID=A0A9P4K6U4_9PLEO|nr:fruit body lectin [Didymosphaeria enalia]
MSYTIKLKVVNNTSDMLTVVEKTCWYYANGGTWTEQGNNHILFMSGSGTSGMLRFRTSAGETFGLAVGIHNYKRWCDLVVDLNDNDTAMKLHPTYYSDSGSRRRMLWNQLSKITKYTPKARALRINFLLGEGNELLAEFTYDEQKPLASRTM